MGERLIKAHASMNREKPRNISLSILRHRLQKETEIAVPDCTVS